MFVPPRREQDRDVWREAALRVEQIRCRRVRAEERDTPASSVQSKTEHDERDVVVFTRWAGEQCSWPDAQVPATSQPHEAPAQHADTEVFLGDRQTAGSPILADFRQRRDEYIA